MFSLYLLYGAAYLRPNIKRKQTLLNLNTDCIDLLSVTKSKGWTKFSSVGLQ